MNQNLTITNYEILSDMILIAFEDNKDIMVDLKTLRENCPCATCQGETDALGNLYKGPKPELNEKSFQINGVQPVGYYGIRPFWKDGHNTGIFTGEQLIKLSQI